MHTQSGIVLKTARMASKELHGFSIPSHFLAESSANVSILGFQQKGAPLEIRQNCWQSANRMLEFVSKRPDRKRKAPAFVSRLLLAAFCFKNGLFGDPGAIRTRDVPLRRRTLYPAEVRDHVLKILISQGFRAFRSS